MGVDVSVDPDLCIGSGDCVRIAPLAFRLADDDSVSRPTAEAPACAVEQLLDAARSCPTRAIRLVRDGVVLHESA